MALAKLFVIPGSEPRKTAYPAAHIAAKPTSVYASVHFPPGQHSDQHWDDAQEHCEAAGLTITRENKAGGYFQVHGDAAAILAAFAVEMQSRQSGTRSYHTHLGNVSAPAGVTAVLGLDNRRVAEPHNRPAAAGAAAPWMPVDLFKAYGLGTGTLPPGTPQPKIGILELGGGRNSANAAAAAAAQNYPAPNVTDTVVNGSGPATGTDADGEVELDIQVVAAGWSAFFGTAAEIEMFWCGNTDSDFAMGISDIATSGCAAASCSWGGPETDGTAQYLQTMHTAIALCQTNGVQFTAAAGDNGADDGTGTLVCDYPASDPAAIACGGTEFIGGQPETVWNNGSQGGQTGGGVSTEFAEPPYQQGVAGVVTTGRNEPDVAGNASPDTGWNVWLTDGGEQPIGGTSAVAPMWAAIIAVAVALRGKPFVGPLQTGLYGMASYFNDITSGNNDGYSAKAGYDQCTGLGTPKLGTLIPALVAYQGGMAPTPPPVTPPSPPVTPPAPPAPPTPPAAGALTPAQATAVDGAISPALKQLAAQYAAHRVFIANGQAISAQILAVLAAQEKAVTALE